MKNLLPFAFFIEWALLLSPPAFAATLAPLSAESMQALLGDPATGYALVSRASDRDYTRVDVVTLDPVTKMPKTRTPTALGCARIHASLSGNLFCYSRVQQGKPRYYTAPTGYVFDRRLQLKNAYAPNTGIVSRARFSADGNRVTGTVFTTGHSYGGVGGKNFSTAAYIGSTSEPRPLEDLQRWKISHRGTLVRSPDINIWGVTFDPRDSSHFYVTVYFDGKPYMGEGRTQTKEINIVREAMECPSFSPDGQWIAFKKKKGLIDWAPAVYNLATGQERVFEVPKSVDDQIEWLDSRTLVYEVTDTPLVGGATTSLFTLDMTADRPQPVLWLDDAKSPTFVGRKN